MVVAGGKWGVGVDGGGQSRDKWGWIETLHWAMGTRWRVQMMFY